MAHVPDWMPEEELNMLASAPPASTSISAQRQTEITAMQVFRDNAILAAEAICAIAVSSENERNRLAASKFVIERVLGRTPDAQLDKGPENPWEALFANVAREPTAEERATGARVSRI
jgi:hypothetical protein